MAETGTITKPGPDPMDRIIDSQNLNKFTEQALAKDKEESLELAVRIRWVALAVIGVVVVVTNPEWQSLYYVGLLCGFAVIAWFQRRAGRVGQSQLELFLMACDIVLLAIVILVPNPFSEAWNWPLPVQFRFENFIYFFVLLAGATLSYSWRTVVAMGNWTCGVWAVGLAIYWWFTPENPEQRQALTDIFGSEELAAIVDPNNIIYGFHVQKVVVFMIVAFTLAMTVRRAHRLLIGQAAMERERANLARYFSPNVVEELSHNDEPLKQVRTQDIAVLFVDIVGFTHFAANRRPEEVITTLRSFHGRMEQEVFRHNGTLDKYLGDGLMATFGTPTPTGQDAYNALCCARAMASSVAQWNAERAQRGEPPIKASFGLHFGPAVLGDVGANRLEFAVIGNTVNVASRLEALTREHGVSLIASEALLERVRSEAGNDNRELAGFTHRSGQQIRGLSEPITIGMLS